jgi:hypothetical protein
MIGWRHTVINSTFQLAESDEAESNTARNLLFIVIGQTCIPEAP